MRILSLFVCLSVALADKPPKTPRFSWIKTAAVVATGAALITGGANLIFPEASSAVSARLSDIAQPLIVNLPSPVLKYRDPKSEPVRVEASKTDEFVQTVAFVQSKMVKFVRENNFQGALSVLMEIGAKRPMGKTVREIIKKGLPKLDRAVGLLAPDAPDVAYWEALVGCVALLDEAVSCWDSLRVAYVTQQSPARAVCRDSVSCKSLPDTFIELKAFNLAQRTTHQYRDHLFVEQVHYLLSKLRKPPGPIAGASTRFSTIEGLRQVLQMYKSLGKSVSDPLSLLGDLRLDEIPQEDRFVVQELVDCLRAPKEGAIGELD